AIYPQVLVSYANEARVQVLGGDKLATSPTLEEAAKMKAEDMAKNGYFAHTSPAGKTPWYWLDQAGYNFSYAGENLAVNFVGSEDVQNAWMASPSHKENILNPNFSEIGIATATGTYQGKEAIFVVEFFGTPAVSELAKVTETPVSQQAIKTANIEVSSTVAGVSAVATSGLTAAFPYAKGGQVFAAYEEKTPSFWGNLMASPAQELPRVFVIFIALILAVIFGAGLWELRRHYVSIWLHGSLFLLAFYSLVVATMYLQLSVPQVL
ncbi:MAG TPA: CAP domain-containing protein, partial [Candidatus Paceibacterota bacterium]|nr:CAP domain-containing protein [Candidatus Paceibacterota bacterium]